MRSRTTAQFRKALADLPTEVQEQAREAYGKIRENPRHPSLRFKQVRATLPIYSARVGLRGQSLRPLLEKPRDPRGRPRTSSATPTSCPGSGTE